MRIARYHAVKNTRHTRNFGRALSFSARPHYNAISNTGSSQTRCAIHSGIVSLGVFFTGCAFYWVYFLLCGFFLLGDATGVVVFETNFCAACKSLPCVALNSGGIDDRTWPGIRGFKRSWARISVSPSAVV